MESRMYGSDGRWLCRPRPLSILLRRRCVSTTHKPVPQGCRKLRHLWNIAQDFSTPGFPSIISPPSELVQGPLAKDSVLAAALAEGSALSSWLDVLNSIILDPGVSELLANDARDFLESKGCCVKLVPPPDEFLPAHVAPQYMKHHKLLEVKSIVPRRCLLRDSKINTTLVEPVATVPSPSVALLESVFKKRARRGEAHKETDLPGTFEDLCAFAKEYTVFLIGHNAEPDAVDLLEELEIVHEIAQLVDNNMYSRV
ncbi:hypothetical protein B0H11DRAFT_2218124 [Mycena galericulata]|nr:hypothetical protein B0H11DRAFT_2218124 [Mycena galericulata]